MGAWWKRCALNACALNLGALPLRPPQVRIWRVVRTQAEIMKYMRTATGLENHKDLAAYWKFDEPNDDHGQFRRHLIAKDSSGRGNDLSLLNPPRQGDAAIKKGDKELRTGAPALRPKP